MINLKDFHTSVHSQMSCQDCHSRADDGRLHPDPSLVNRPLSSFFDHETCLECHDVMDDIENGSHGRTDTSADTNCIACHNPHYQEAVSEPSNADTPLCARCHEPRENLPEPLEEDRACLDCHEQKKEGHGQVPPVCSSCHIDEKKTNVKSDASGPVPVRISGSQPAGHETIACQTCHKGAAEFPHSDQESAACLGCHTRHTASDIGDYHLTVTCRACHLKGTTPVKSEDGMIVSSRGVQEGQISNIHDMALPDDQSSCSSCHYEGNTLGASGMVLPIKSLICMGCHPSSPVLSDTISRVSVIGLIIGLFLTLSAWFSAGSTSSAFGAGIRVIFSLQIGSALKGFLLDGIFMRRLFAFSKQRWVIHALIIYPFIFRFLWGLAGLIGSHTDPRGAAVWMLLDKNQPLTAFLFDLTGVMVLAGAFCMVILKKRSASNYDTKSLPAPDWPAHMLISGIMIVGFILEGMRIAMNGTPQGSTYAFIGYAVSKLFLSVNTTSVYGYIWYLHAVLTGLFLVYLPFSRMMHIILIPLVAAMNAVDRKHNKKEH